MAPAAPPPATAESELDVSGRNSVVESSVRSPEEPDPDLTSREEEEPCEEDKGSLPAAFGLI